MKTMIRTLILASFVFGTSHVGLAQWHQANGLYGGTVNCLVESGTNFYAGTDSGGVFLFIKEFTSWKAVNTGLTNISVHTLAVSGINLFAGTDSGVFLSTNNGASWTQVNTGLTNTNVRAFAVCGPNLFVGTCYGYGDADVFLSTNNGTSWSAVGTGSVGDGVESFAVSPIGTNHANLFAGTITNHDIGGGGVYLSTNNGASWSRVGLNHFAVHALAFSGENLFAGHSEGLVSFAKNDTNWAMTSWGSMNTAVYALSVFGRNLFAGTSVGVFLSTDDGTSWNSINAGLTDTRVVSLAVSGTELFAGTRGSGVWRRQLSEITGVVEHKNELPTQFCLPQNYPNPFNPTTAISYQLPAVSYVTLKVYDLLGREVATLVNEVKQAGSYSANWDASRLSSGVYFYQLEAGQFRETKRMILMK